MTTAAKIKPRFKVTQFTNASGSQSFRVSGSKRNGERVRENFILPDDASARCAALEAEYRSGQSEMMLRATRLTDSQISLAEKAFALVEDERDVLRGIRYFLDHGKQLDVTESKTADEAFDSFKKWLDGKPDSTGNGICQLRPVSRAGLRQRVERFVDGLGLIQLADISADDVERHLTQLPGGLTNKDGVKRSISRFFSWCMERPRQWRRDNPAALVKIELPEKGEPQILNVDQCEKLLRACEKNGLAVYTAISLFAGLRPWEVRRLAWDNINLEDGEIRINGSTSKTGRSRIVPISPALAAWLKAYKGKPVFKTTFVAKLRDARAAAGIKSWCKDIMRHTAISFACRQHDSFIDVANNFGNSESIIRRHYQSRVSSADAKRFFALRPTKGAK
ncbi:MAG: tyrosine-type recombinase/integrase [Verrucomicrobiota bacterium]|jgi:integrase